MIADVRTATWEKDQLGAMRIETSWVIPHLSDPRHRATVEDYLSHGRSWTGSISITILYTERKSHTKGVYLRPRSQYFLYLRTGREGARLDRSIVAVLMLRLLTCTLQHKLVSISTEAYCLALLVQPVIVIVPLTLEHFMFSTQCWLYISCISETKTYTGFQH